MYEVYLWNTNTNNKIFITSFTTMEEAEEYCKTKSTNEFIYYVKTRKDT